MFLYKDLTDKILRACYNVHNGLGCGFFEKVYQEALAIELTEMNTLFEAQLINYMKATHIKVGYLINFGQERLYYKRYARY